MSEDTENFEQLRRLLVLKRYEQPPPRYFNDFSAQVIRRIKAGERGEARDFLQRLFGEAPWLQRVLAVFEAKPVLAGVLGVSMCGLLIAGGLYTDTADVPPIGLVPGMDPAPGEQAKVGAMDHPLFQKQAALETSSTSPISAAQAQLLLEGVPKLGVGATPANWTFPGGN